MTPPCAQFVVVASRPLHFAFLSARERKAVVRGKLRDASPQPEGSENALRQCGIIAFVTPYLN